MMELIHITAAYSNAVLVAILPQVSDFAKKLNLPVPQPITASQVVHFGIPPRKGEIGGGIWLSNHFWFAYSDGHVDSFRSPDNMFGREDLLENWRQFTGKENMTTNQAIEMARDTLRKLGYNLQELHVDVPPTSVQLPFDYQGYHIPQVQMRWDGPDEADPTGHDLSVHVTFAVNLDKKTITQFTLISGKLRRPPPKVDVEPELESDYLKNHSFKMFTRTNAPPRFPTSEPDKRE